MKLDLTGAWQFKSTAEEAWHEATVPGCSYTDLVAAKLLPDPFYRDNELRSLDVARCDYEYRKSFFVTAQLLSADSVTLEFKLLDTLATIYLNDAEIAKTKNGFIGYSFEVKALLKEGENTLRVVFASPVEFIETEQKRDSMPRSFNGLNGAPHLRKAQYQFGWDWGPVLPPVGISDEVYLESHTAVVIEDVGIAQTHDFAAKRCTLDFTVAVKQLSDAPYTLNISVLAPTGERFLLDYADASRSVTITEPQLWWPNGLTERTVQPLYTVTVLAVGSDGTEYARATKEIGLRTLTLNREADKYGKNFCFTVNGVPVFCKGANWIPADSFSSSITPEKIDYYVTAMRDTNMNMVRVWGGGFYETDLFYSLCDKYGIMIWQDFCFACAPYPFYDEAFLDTVKEEIAYNVKRLRSHASLAVYCGNNELESCCAAWLNKTKLLQWTEKFFYHILPEEIAKYDTVTPYTPGSPAGDAYMKNFTSDDCGDTHLWNVWHGLKKLSFYRTRLTRFCSEFGMESLPSMDVINSFAKPEDYSITGDVFMAHQKCKSGNRKMLFYLASRYYFPKKFEDLVYMTGLIQKECIEDATEHWRRNMYRCNGSLFWQLNDCWPAISWASIDYFGKYKALQYRAKHFNSPICVSLDNAKTKVKAFVINDLTSTQQLRLVCELIDFNGEKLFSEGTDVTAAPVAAKLIKEYDCLQYADKKKLSHCVFSAKLYRGEEVISTRTCLFGAERKLPLPTPKYTYTLAKTDEKSATLTLSSPVFCRSVMLDVPGLYLPFSDNYFDLLPGEEITVTIPLGNMSFEDVKSLLTLKSVGDVEVIKSDLKCFFFRLGTYLIPLNLANYFIYSK